MVENYQTVTSEVLMSFRVVLFPHTGEQFTVRKCTGKAIEEVCTVMCERKDLHDEDRVYYANIMGAQEGESFEDKYNARTYAEALIPVLFEDPPGKIDLDQLDYEAVRDAINFFLSRLGYVMPVFGGSMMPFLQRLSLSRPTGNDSGEPGSPAI